MSFDDMNDISISDLLKQIAFDTSNIYVEPDSGETLSFDFEVKSYEFLRFAENDLSQENSHGLINALSNAKRAIDCQIETFLGCFGLQNKNNFPKKIELLKLLGIVTPRIIKKVIHARNLLEHEFKNPDKERVEDAVDIAALFVLILEQKLRFAWTGFCIAEDLDNSQGLEFPFKRLYITFDSTQKNFEIRGLLINLNEIDHAIDRRVLDIGVSTIRPKDPGYLELVNMVINLDSKSNMTIDDLDLDMDNVRKAKAFIDLFI